MLYIKQITNEIILYSVKSVTQSCPTLCDPVGCSLPGSSVHGILQARILEWAAIPFSRGSSRPRDQTLVSYLHCRQILDCQSHTCNNAVQHEKFSLVRFGDLHGKEVQKGGDVRVRGADSFCCATETQHCKATALQ